MAIQESHESTEYCADQLCAGITTTFEIPFETRPPTYAKFDKDEAVYHWSISSRTLRKLVDHFHPTIELLDINSDGERVVNFGCFPEKGGNIEGR